MASSTPGSVPPPDIARAPIVSAVIADQRRLPKLSKPAGPYRRAWWRLRSDRVAMLAFFILAVLILIAYVVPLLIAIDPYQQSLRDSLLPPGTAGHVLGTDHFGRDVLLRLIDGGRVSLSVGIFAVVISASIGGLIGLVSGYFGGWTDRILMRLIDVKLAFPGILLALVIVTVLGTGLEKVMIAVGIGGIPRFARVVRGSVLNTKNELYVEAAQHRRGRSADHVRAPRPASAGSRDHDRHVRARDRDPLDRLTVVPRSRRAAAHGGVGPDAVRGPQIPTRRVVALGVPRPRDRDRRAEREPAWRRGS